MKKRMIFAICREFGSDGHEIGKELSERLGIPLFDKEILERAAEASGVHIDCLAKYDEKRQKGFQASYLLSDDWRMGDRLFRIEAELIRNYAALGSCILVGRLADYILRDDPDCIKVLITAPFAQRTAIVAQRQNCSQEEAAKLVRHMDAQRSAYYQCYSGGKWRHETEKDMILNRGSLGIEGCVDLLYHWAMR